MSDRDQEPAIEVYTSVGGAAFLTRLVSEWQNAGAEIASVHAVSDSEYRAARGMAGRVSLRWRMYVGYAWKCWWAARKSRGLPGVRVVTTNPFFAPSLVRLATQGRGLTVNLLYDLFPDVLIQAGRVGAGSIPAASCSAITRYAIRECAATVFLGDRLRTHAELTYGPARHGVVIPIGADGGPFRSFPPEMPSGDACIRILYSGLMGEMHDTETLAAAWQKGTPANLVWTFNASGVAYERLRRTLACPTKISWGGPLNQENWMQEMKVAHVALVTIAAGAERAVMPSKTYSAMVAGQAILAVCRRDSDLADLVAVHDCGWVVEPGDVESLRRTLESIEANRDEVHAKRIRAFEAGHRLYDMAPISRAWMALFREIAENAAAPNSRNGMRPTA